MEKALRLFLILDAVILCTLGLLFVLAPRIVITLFQFHDLPVGVHYIIGTLGCVYLSLAPGYFMTAIHPRRNIAWIQAGIVRGALECGMGIAAVAQGIVTFEQARIGIAAGAAVAILYLVLYPRAMPAPTAPQAA